MDHDSPEVIRKHVRVYMGVFVTLIIMTILTVVVNSMHFGGIIGAVIVAMIIAAFKGSLVAGFFMHLIGEKKIILWTLVLTAFMFAGLMFIPLMESNNSAGKSIQPPVKNIEHVHGGDAHAEEGAEAAH